MLCRAGKYFVSFGKRFLPVFALFCWCVLFVAHAAAAVDEERPQYRFDSWTTDNGLPQVSINSILQTRDGFLWVATFGGLVRYDGLRFEVFNTGNTKGLKTSRFISLFEDGEENLWITTEGQGITLYKNGIFTTFTTENGLLNNQINHIGRDGEGNLIIETGEGLMRWDGENFRSHSLAAGGGQIKSVLQFKQNGDFWFRDGADLRKSEKGRVTAGFTPNFTVKRVFEDSANRLWIASDGDNLLMFAADGNLTAYGENNGYPYFRYSVAFEDAQKNLWFGTRDGLVLFREGKFTRYTVADGLVGNDIKHIFQDREGTFWVGTGSGLSRMQHQVVTGYSTKDGLAADNVYPIYQDRRGRIWIGSWKGLTIYENGQFRNEGRRFSVENEEVMSFLEDRDGNFWIGTWGGGVRLVKNDEVTTFSPTELPGNRVRVIYQDRAGNIWFGTVEGLSKTKPSAAGERKSIISYTAASGFTGKGVTAIFEDRAGQLWIGTESGLFKYKDGGFTKFAEADGFAGGIVRSIYEDADGALWIGMYDSGIYRVRDGRFTHYTADEGLFDNGAFQILEDGAANFWVSSNVGIYRVKKSDLNDFADGKIRRFSSILYNKRDGMLSSECNGGGQSAGIKARDGRLWFPTQKGVAVIAPETVSLNAQPPPVVIESFLVDTKLVEKISPVRIQPGQVYFEIHYSGLSFIQPELVRFKYKLEGLDDEWTEAGTRRTAYFSHLPPGKYVFRVLAANRDGVWNEQGASLEIVVLPSFYQTWLFWTLAALAFALFVFLIYRRRVRALEQGRAAQEAFSRQLIESQETERRRIAAELHDSLGQSLVLIRNWALLGLRATNGGDKEKTNLDEISETASEAIKEVREIAYNLGPYQLERLGLRHTIEEMVQKVAGTSAIEFRTDIGVEIDDCFSKQVEVGIFRIVQEAVNNIVKHSGASAANLKIEMVGEMVMLTVKDNGKGFAPGNSSDGFGLLGMKERVRLLRGVLTVESEVGGGTTVRATLPCRTD